MRLSNWSKTRFKVAQIANKCDFWLFWNFALSGPPWPLHSKFWIPFDPGNAGTCKVDENALTI